MNSPLLTIAIPTYNGSRTLLQTLESALLELKNSNRDDVNIEIFDNGSTGTSKKILDSIELPKGSFIHFSKENLGYDFNVKRSVEESSGRFVKIIADDDNLEPGSLLRLLAVIEENPNVAFIVADFSKVTQDLTTEIEPPILPMAHGGLHFGESGLALSLGRFGQVSSLTFNRALFSATRMRQGLGTNYIHVFAIYALALDNPFYICTGKNMLVRDGSPNFSASKDKIISTPVNGLGAIRDLRAMGYSKKFVKLEYKVQAKYVSGLMLHGKLNNVQGLGQYLFHSFSILGPRLHLVTTAILLAMPGRLLKVTAALLTRLRQIIN